MELKGEALLVRVFIGEADKVHHKPLFEAIVQAAREAGLAGATVWRGMLGFGAASRIRSAKLLDLSSDLPIVVEIVDREDRITSFLPRLHELIDGADCGGLVTMERVQIIRYLHSPRASARRVGQG
ncbi:MAG: DUF190 domain-containing protein [bacterium]|nr:DUF190 domain-containing protein [bacterium]